MNDGPLLQIAVGAHRLWGRMFNGIWLVAAEPLTIGGREYQAGERFEISRTQSGALLVMGRAMIAGKPKAPEPAPNPPKRRRGRPRKVQSAESVSESVTESVAEPASEQLSEEPTRSYHRRDLEAEE